MMVRLHDIDHLTLVSKWQVHAEGLVVPKDPLTGLKNLVLLYMPST